MGGANTVPFIVYVNLVPVIIVELGFQGYPVEYIGSFLGWRVRCGHCIPTTRAGRVRERFGGLRRMTTGGDKDALSSVEARILARGGKQSKI
jgi:hypothetical protein